MKHDFSKIELAFDYVSAQGPSINCALISKKTGQIFCGSDLGDADEDFPDEPDEDDYFFIPHKNDLDLGIRLVHRFATNCAPHLADEIKIIFSRKGAYSRFKELLRTNGLLDAWYTFENSAVTEALLKWCRDSGIELNDPLPKQTP